VLLYCHRFIAGLIVSVAGMPFWRLLLPVPRVPLENARIHSLENIQDFIRDKKHLSFVAGKQQFPTCPCGNGKKNSLEKGRRRRNRKRNNAMLLLHLSTFFVSICCNSVNEWKWVVHDAASDELQDGHCCQQSSSSGGVIHLESILPSIFCASLVLQDVTHRLEVNCLLLRRLVCRVVSRRDPSY
jgi:hypothetical protein